MGGTIASRGSMPMLPATVPGGPFVGAVSGGGPVAPASQGTRAAPAVGGDIAIALANLQAALRTLEGAVQALAGARQVTAGGPAGPPGCGCGGGSPTQTPPGMEGASPRGADAAPEAPPTTLPPGAGDVRQKIVDIARAELAKGVQEDGADRDSGGNIVKYRSAVTGAGEDPKAAEPWCADFASWVSLQAGVPIGKDGKGEDYTGALIDWAKSAGRWHDRARADPKQGDLVFIDWGGGADVDHVAVVEKVEGGKVFTIGGNESNGIKAASYPVGDPRMMGFVTPAGA